MVQISLRNFEPKDVLGEGDIGDEPIIGATAEIDGTVAGYAGLRLVAGRHWGFFRLLDERARRPALVHRATRAALDAAEICGITPIFTFCDDTHPRAEAWLRRLGFRPLRDDEKDAAIRATERQVNHNAWIRERR